MEPSIIERVTSINELASIKTVGGVGLRLGTLIKRTSKGSMMKKCTKCGVEKDESEFNKSTKSPDGYQYWCKTCQQEYDKDNAEAVRLRHAKYYAEHREAIKKRSADRYREQSYGINSARKDYYAKNRIAVLERLKIKARTDPKYMPKRLFTSIRSRAKKNGIQFNLTRDDLKEIPRTCPVLGIPITLSGEPNSPHLASVDRVIPELGYTKSNIHIISFRANTIKSDATIEELELVLAYMKRHEAARREATNNLTTSAPVGSIDSGAHLTERTSDE